jgi:hypothetical protein
MRHSPFSITATAGAVVLTAAANADVTLISHQRSISADTYVLYFTGDDTITDSDYDSGQTSAPGAWSDAAYAHAVADWLYADGWAEQASLVSTSALSGTGEAEYDINANSSMSDAEAVCDSLYDVVFQVAAAQPYELDVTLAAWSGDGLTYAYAELWDINTMTSYFYQWHEGNERSWSLAGTLPTGTYGLSIHAYASGYVHVDADTGWAWFDFTLSVPSPGSAACLALGAALATCRRR